LTNTELAEQRFEQAEEKLLQATKLKPGIEPSTPQIKRSPEMTVFKRLFPLCAFGN
jgi:hypothetical protein